MLYLECNADLTLAQALTRLPRREIAHERKGKGEILKQLARRFDCQALLDEDPGQAIPAYLARLPVTADYAQLGLRVYADAARRNRVILLRPRLEEWLLRAAADSGLRVGDRRYNLPNNPARLHQEINLDLSKVARLLSDLIAADAPRLQQLRNLLTGV